MKDDTLNICMASYMITYTLTGRPQKKTKKKVPRFANYSLEISLQELLLFCRRRERLAAIRGPIWDSNCEAFLRPFCGWMFDPRLFFLSERRNRFHLFWPCCKSRTQFSLTGSLFLSHRHQIATSYLLFVSHFNWSRLCVYRVLCRGTSFYLALCVFKRLYNFYYFSSKGKPRERIVFIKASEQATRRRRSLVGKRERERKEPLAFFFFYSSPFSAQPTVIDQRWLSEHRALSLPVF